MNPSSLHALIIDRHFGELTPEVAELLDLHLAQNAAARAEADRILETLSVTRDAMYEHPELARVPDQPKAAPVVSRPFFASSWLARAAAILLLAALTAAGGFMAGRSTTPAPAPTIVATTAKPSAPARKASPWARYRMTFEPGSNGSGMQVVRVDIPDRDKNSFQ